MGKNQMEVVRIVSVVIFCFCTNTVTGRILGRNRVVTDLKRTQVRVVVGFGRFGVVLDRRVEVGQ